MSSEQLRRLRQQMGLTLEEFGKLFDWSTTTTWRKELSPDDPQSSKIKKPEAEVIRRIAKEHGIKI